MEQQAAARRELAAARRAADEAAATASNARCVEGSLQKATAVKERWQCERAREVAAVRRAADKAAATVASASQASGNCLSDSCCWEVGHWGSGVLLLFEQILLRFCTLTHSASVSKQMQ